MMKRLQLALAALLLTASFGAADAARADVAPPPAPPPAPAPAPPPADAPPTAADGEKIWNDKKSKCATCHGPDGKGDTKMGKSKKVTDMTTEEWQKKFTDQQIIDAILKGVEREEGGRKVKMDPMKGATQRDAEALLAFIRTFAPKK